MLRLDWTRWERCWVWAVTGSSLQSIFSPFKQLTGSISLMLPSGSIIKISLSNCSFHLDHGHFRDFFVGKVFNTTKFSHCGFRVPVFTWVNYLFEPRYNFFKKSKSVIYSGFVQSCLENHAFWDAYILWQVSLHYFLYIQEDKKQSLASVVYQRFVYRIWVLESLILSY